MSYAIGGYLLWLCVEDIRKKQLSLWILLIGCVGSALYCVLYREFIWIIMGILPGAVLLLVSFLIPGSIGSGDGILAITYGMVFGWRQVSIWLIVSFLLAAVFGVIWKSIERRKYAMIPFVPFLTLTHMGLCL